MSANEIQKLKVKCRTCRNITNHNIVEEYIENVENGIIKPFNLDMNYWRIIKCNGCETVSFCMSHHLSNDEERTFTYLYPLRENKLLKSFPNSPESVQILYKETIASYNYLNKTLCVAGIRAIIEAICIDKNIFGRIVKKRRECCQSEYDKNSNDLKTKISLLDEKNYIASSHSDALQKLRIIGNKALHEIKVPSDEDLNIALELIEDTINYIYEIPRKGDSLG